MNSIKKNTVSASNQIKSNFKVQFFGSDAPSKKVLIMGNSITYHGQKADIGWSGNWGMAASKAENDYIHILYEKASKICPEVQFCVVQVASLENDFCNKNRMEEYDIIRSYAPDIAILRFGENIRIDAYDLTELEKNYKYFLQNYLVCNNSHLIFSTCFWNNGFVDDMIKKYCAEYGGTLVELNDLGDDDSMKAIGLFEHTGVANHPGDLGMKMIAERIYNVLKELL